MYIKKTIVSVLILTIITGGSGSKNDNKGKDTGSEGSNIGRVESINVWNPNQETGKAIATTESEEVVERPIVCKTCGEHNKIDQRFCTYCKQPIKVYWKVPEIEPNDRQKGT
ncbi:uncharacterized protein LOC126842237 [Adelges cooleyi]|uniref:uncharacterized protein LOC126842237 n=1 Tax=Adelges cooleyi TaxID=133065 RepID=UPI00217F66AD|nr:uncharacterized protein LOC126842237 [Adelges cooleyi]